MAWGDRSLEAEVIDGKNRKGLQLGERDEDDFVIAHGARLELTWLSGTLQVRFSTGVAGTAVLGGAPAVPLGQLIQDGKISEKEGLYSLTLGDGDSLSLQVGGPRIDIRQMRARVTRLSPDTMALAALVGALVCLTAWLLATFNGFTPLNLIPKDEVPQPSMPTYQAPTDHLAGVEGRNPSFDRQMDPERVVRFLELKPGMHVADVGAGRGYFVRRLAQGVGPTGLVVATDIDARAIRSLQEVAKDLPNVSVREGQPMDPMLEAGAFDLIFMSSVDHYLQDRVAFIEKLKVALKPGGMIAIGHTQALKPPLLEAATKAGLEVVRTDDRPDFYFLMFKPR